MRVANISWRHSYLSSDTFLFHKIVVVVLSIPLVLANGGLGVYLLYDIENYGDDDEECGAAYGECGDTSDALENKRQDGKGAKKECSNERDTGDDVGEIFSGLRARAYSRDECAVFLKIFCDLMRLEGDCGIKVGENNHKTEVHRPIDPLIGEARDDRACGTREPRNRAMREERRYHLRKEKDGECEDDRHDSCLVDSKWQVGGDATHHAHPSHTPSIGNRNWPLRLGDEDDTCDDDDRSCGKPKIRWQLRHIEREYRL